MRRAVLSGIACVLLYGIPLAAAAAYDGTLQLSMSPQYPQPGDAVALTATDYSGNPDAMTYLWSIDGSTVLRGVGAKTLTTTAGPAGSATKVSVTVAANGIAMASGTATIRPGDVDLVWEGDTSVPPFYTGRPLPNGQSPVSVLAIPHIGAPGSEVPGDSLVYRWQVNGTPVSGASGYGKSFAILAPPVFAEPFTVSVRIETVDGTEGAYGTVTIAPRAPAAMVYEDAPLLGVRFEKAVTESFLMKQDEASFAAFPLFASAPASLSYQWTLDGSPFSVDPTQPGDVTFRKQGGGSGAHPVMFSYSNPKAFLENATASFTLTF